MFGAGRCYLEDKWPLCLTDPPVIAGGAAPMLTVGHLTAPFVAYVHIRLPLQARLSINALSRWSRNIPPLAEVDLTTMRFIGVPRVTRLRFSELRHWKGRFADITNLISTRGCRGKVTRWGRPQTRFFVGRESQRTPGSLVWKSAVEQIR